MSAAYWVVALGAAGCAVVLVWTWAATSTRRALEREMRQGTDGTTGPR